MALSLRLGATFVVHPRVFTVQLFHKVYHSVLHAFVHLRTSMAKPLPDKLVSILFFLTRNPTGDAILEFDVGGILRVPEVDVLLDFMCSNVYQGLCFDVVDQRAACSHCDTLGSALPSQAWPLLRRTWRTFWDGAIGAGLTLRPRWSRVVSDDRGWHRLDNKRNVWSPLVDPITMLSRSLSSMGDHGLELLCERVHGCCIRADTVTQLLDELQVHLLLLMFRRIKAPIEVKRGGVDEGHHLIPSPHPSKRHQAPVKARAFRCPERPWARTAAPGLRMEQLTHLDRMGYKIGHCCLVLQILVHRVDQTGDEVVLLHMLLGLHPRHKLITRDCQRL